MTTSEPYTRQSTLLELSRTPIGRLLRRLIAQLAKQTAKNPTEARLFAGAAGYLTVEKIVSIGAGKVPWPVADGVIDIANGRSRDVLRRAVTASTDAARAALGSGRAPR